MVKCSWNVIKSNNSRNVWGGKGQDFFLWKLIQYFKYNKIEEKKRKNIKTKLIDKEFTYSKDCLPIH
jgi:hypothetical protein